MTKWFNTAKPLLSPKPSKPPDLPRLKKITRESGQAKNMAVITSEKKSQLLRRRVGIFLGFLTAFFFICLLQLFWSFLQGYCGGDKEWAKLFGENGKWVQSAADETGRHWQWTLQDQNDHFILKNHETNTSLKLGKRLDYSLVVEKEINEYSLSVKWSSSVSVTIARDDKFDRCINVNWRSSEPEEPSEFLDCFDLEGKHWFGGAELYKQEWPLEKASIDMMPYLPSDTILGIGRGKKVYGPVLERYWFTSTGMAILVNESVPLHVSVNSSGDRQLCLKADYQDYPSSQTPLHLSYKICVGDNAKDIHQFVMKQFFQHPTGIPDVRMMKEPIWSTWAQFGKGVTQDKIMGFVQKIKESGFSHSQIEIDDKYSTVYGEFDFDSSKFLDPKSMINSLHNDSFRVTIWVYPFANTDSKAFQEGMNYWVKGVDESVPGLLKWWNGIAATVDTTNIQAAEWYRNRLKTFLDAYNIDGLKFDAGELTYLPMGYHLHTLQNNSPDIYSMKYAEIAASFGKLIEVRVGHQTQNLPIFVRMLDRSSRWDENNGLHSVIPTTLTFGILGYPFVLPDMIGGNGFQLSVGESDDLAMHVERPDSELFVRWVQANAFLPAMQFSFAPWDIDNKTVNITRKTLQMREEMADYIVACAREATQSGAPIVRPLWWIAPSDPIAQEIYTEFMLGDQFLVAPVLTPMNENKGKHPVYLPRGKWKEEFASKKLIDVDSEGMWIEYNVTIEDLPYYSLVSK